MFLWHKPVFYAMWSPLTWLVGYIDPRKGADQDIMHGMFLLQAWGPPLLKSTLARFIMHGLQEQRAVYSRMQVSCVRLCVCRVVLPVVVGQICVDLGHVVWDGTAFLPVCIERTGSGM